jgi:membrane peptidoglycan carboxypeptidase
METTTQPRNQVEAAQIRIDEMLESMMRGERITAKQLADARAELELAEMRDEAQARQETRGREAARRAELEALQQRLASAFDLQAIEALGRELEKALDKYLAAIVVHEGGLKEMRDALRAGGFLPRMTPGEIAGLPASDGNPVSIGDVAVRSVLSPRGTILRMVDAVISRHFPRGTS